LQRRFTNGLSMGLQYTWAKELGTSSGSNEATTAQEPLQIYGQAPEYGRGINDIRSSLNATVLFDVPVGKGKPFDLGSVGNAFVGGWQIGSIVNFRTGVPIDVLITRPDVAYVGKAGTAYAGQTFSNPIVVGGVVQTTAVQNVPGGGNSRNVRRPNRVPGVNPYLKQGLQYLNPAAFTTPAPGTFGNQRRNDVSGPSLAQLDMTLQKEFAMTERVHFKLTADAFNILNHANFANPGNVRLAQVIPSTATGGAQPGTPFGLTGASGAGTNFGTYSATVGNQVGLGAQRQIQLSGRLTF